MELVKNEFSDSGVVGAGRPCRNTNSLSLYTDMLLDEYYFRGGVGVTSCASVGPFFTHPRHLFIHTKSGGREESLNWSVPR